MGLLDKAKLLKLEQDIKEIKQKTAKNAVKEHKKSGRGLLALLKNQNGDKDK